MKDGYWEESYTIEGSTYLSKACFHDHPVLPIVFPRCEKHEFNRPTANVVEFQMVCKFGDSAATEASGVVSGDLNTSFTTEVREGPPPGVVVARSSFRYLGSECPAGT